MAEKGGTKILVIITIIIVLLSIGFSGCVEEGKEEDKDEEKNFPDAKEGDLKMTISSDNHTFSVT